MILLLSYNFYQKLKMEQHHIDSIIPVIKSLFDIKYDRFAHVNSEGYMENSIVLNDYAYDADDDYDSEINNILVENLEGLEILEEANLITIFNYNGVEFMMFQYASIDFDSMYFVFTLCNKEPEFQVSNRKSELDC
jgi:hypothetical protein